MHWVMGAGVTQLDDNRRIDRFDIDEIKFQLLGSERLCGNEKREKKQHAVCTTVDRMELEFVEENPHVDLIFGQMAGDRTINVL